MVNLEARLAGELSLGSALLECIADKLGSVPMAIGEAKEVMELTEEIPGKVAIVGQVATVDNLVTCLREVMEATLVRGVKEDTDHTNKLIDQFPAG